MAEAQDRPPQSAPPSPAELLRAALEKIVFFEWRLSEIASELAAAQSRAASADVERARAEEAARAAQAQCQAARLQSAELEADRARLAALLARPALSAPADTHALESERARAAMLEAERDEARRELERQKAERQRWLTEMVEQARQGDEAPAALAQFISELRGEVIALRERARQADALLAQAGLPLPPPSEPPPVSLRPARDPQPVEAARQLWAEGRLGGTAAELDRAHAHASLRPGRGPETAALALAEQCLRSLSSHDPSRREQAARHLAAVPSPAAAPLLAGALGEERDPKARAQLARALAACGGDGAAGMVSQLQGAAEAPLVRLAALEALCLLGPGLARSALEAASRDASAAVRRRAAALAAATEGAGEILARLSADADASVRATCGAATTPAALPVDEEPAAPPVDEEPAPRSAPPLDAPARAALLAVQASIFGLTAAELGEAIGLSESEASALCARLLDEGRLARRGKRLVASPGGTR